VCLFVFCYCYCLFCFLFSNYLFLLSHILHSNHIFVSLSPSTSFIPPAPPLPPTLPSPPPALSTRLFTFRKGRLLRAIKHCIWSYNKIRHLPAYWGWQTSRRTSVSKTDNIIRNSPHFDRCPTKPLSYTTKTDIIAIPPLKTRNQTKTTTTKKPLKSAMPL